VSDAAVPRPADALHRAGTDGLANLAASVIGGVVTLIMVLVVTRQRGPEGAGAFFVAIAVFAILSNIAELGADTGLLWSIPQALAAGRRDTLVRMLRIAFVPPVIASSLAAVALTFAAGPISSLAGSDSAETAAIVRGLAPFLPFSVVTTMALAATRGFGQMGPTIWIDRITRTLVQCAAVVLVAGHGGVALGMAYGAPQLLATGLAVMALRGLVAGPKRSTDAPEQPCASFSDALLTRQFWTFAAPRALSAGATILVEKADVLMVAGLVSTTAAGVYSATTRLAVIGTIGAVAVMQASQPIVSYLLARSRGDEARRIAQAATTWTVLVTWPVFGALALLAADVMPVFGTGFGDGRDALVVVAVGMLLVSSVGPSEVTLLMSGGSRRAMLNTLAALVVNVGANIVLIPHFGITGAAVAGALSLAVVNLAAVVQVHALLGFFPFARSWVIAATTVTLALAAGYGAAAVATGHATRIAVFALTGAVVYLPVVGLMRHRLELPSTRLATP